MNIAEILTFIDTIIGTGGETLTIIQILTRCVIIYIFGIMLVRIGKKRFLGKIAAFDAILAIIIGSLLSRAITDNSYFLQIMAACLLLILIHRAFSLIAAYSDRFGNWIKGRDRVILEDGEVLWKAMRKSNLSEQDLMQSLRLNGRTTEISRIKIARLERNGDISIIMMDENKIEFNYCSFLDSGFIKIRYYFIRLRYFLHNHLQIEGNYFIIKDYYTGWSGLKSSP